MAEPKIARGMGEREVLARTLYGEARSGGIAGMEDVAQVILTRARNPRWWGSSVREVCLQRMQFSVWWVKDPNQAKMLAATDVERAYAQALDVADRAIQNRLGTDRTKGADHYYAPAGMDGGDAPRWADEGKFTYASKGHRFYRIEVPVPVEHKPETPKSYATVTATAAAGTVATVAQAMGDLDWRVAVALIVAVAAGALVWRFWLAKKEAAE